MATLHDQHVVAEVMTALATPGGRPRWPAPLSFGGGIHYCLGAPPARLEADEPAAVHAVDPGPGGDPVGSIDP